MDLYREADQMAKTQRAAWENFKSTQLPQLNHALRGAGVPVITVSAGESRI
jgi:hypothetical protein